MLQSCDFNGDRFIQDSENCAEIRLIARRVRGIAGDPHHPLMREGGVRLIDRQANIYDGRVTTRRVGRLIGAVVRRSAGRRSPVGRRAFVLLRSELDYRQLNWPALASDPRWVLVSVPVPARSRQVFRQLSRRDSNSAVCGRNRRLEEECRTRIAQIPRICWSWRFAQFHIQRSGADKFAGGTRPNE